MTDSHQKFLALLPWYVNDTLDESERDALRAHLGHCLPCHAALREERRLMQALRDQDSVPLGQERRLSELLQRIDRGQRLNLANNPGSWLSGYRLAGAAAAVLAVIGLWYVQQNPSFNEGSYSTLFSTTSSMPNRIDVIFSAAPDATDLEQFLQQYGASMVSGPTALGRYTIEIAASDSLAEVLAAIGADPRVQFAGQAFADDGGDGAQGR